jgi:hypothetical protein
MYPKLLYLQEYCCENVKSRVILLVSGVLTMSVVFYECLVQITILETYYTSEYFIVSGITYKGC